MTITLSNDKIFLHRDYAIDGIRWYLSANSYESLVFSEECAPFPIELHATVTVPEGECTGYKGATPYLCHHRQ